MTNSAIIYMLGAVGLIAVGMLPLRSWQIVSTLREEKSRAAAALMLLAAAIVLWFDWDIARRIFSCLTTNYCGPSLASGWMYLAMLGAVYVAFEVLAFVVRAFARRPRGEVR